LEITDGTVIADTVADTPCLFLSGLYHAEKGVADRFQHLVLGSLPWLNIDIDKALPWIEKKTGLSLAQSQIEPAFPK
jgi:exodeoxyribonuclease V alpha subunit